MTEENVNVDAVEDDKKVDVPDKQKPQAEEPKFTQAEVDAMMKDRLARADKAKEKAIEEAQKLATMNEEQRKQHEFEQLQKELAEYKQKDTFYSLSKEASNMLAEHGVQANDELLQFVVKSDAEGTQQAVNTFVGLFNKAVEAQVKEKLSGSAPRVNTGNQSGMTKEKIMSEPDQMKRQKLISENLELFQ